MHPSDLRVRDVVAFGCHPHRRRFSPFTDTDQAMVDHAMEHRHAVLVPAAGLVGALTVILADG
ncbi:hypothetical protein [Micromonospora sp. LOL_021]|uniref:hypothetical protein n=1 Tax=Micromonospora sp. LOL_021 TaxID=3345417 RepID=UPI003A84C30A